MDYHQSGKNGSKTEKEIPHMGISLNVSVLTLEPLKRAGNNFQPKNYHIRAMLFILRSLIS